MANNNSHSPYRLFKRGEYWHAYISFIVQGRRVVIRETTGETDIESAQRYCTERINAIRNSPSVTHEITLDEACAKWWNEVGQYHSRPQGTFTHIKNFLLEFDGNLVLSQINRNDINNFIVSSRTKNRSNATINRYLCLLSAICTRAKNNWDCHIPEFKILSFKQKEPKENIKYFKDWQELQKVIDAARPHLKPIILTAVYTGLRRGRILTLKWEQIDWETNQIIYMGKDGNPHSVPIALPLKELLQSLPNNNEYVFTYHGHRITDIKTGWKSAFEKAGVPYRNFHALRHTTATWLLQKTGNIRVVQNVLGHHSISTTTKYAHLVNNESQAALNCLFAQNMHNKNTNSAENCDTPEDF